MGQAIVAESINRWDIFSYTDDNFEWTNLSSTPIETGKKEQATQTDNSVATGNIPQAGIELEIVLVIIALLGVSIFVYRKYNKYKEI